MVILDTNVLSILEWQDSPAALRLQRRMEQHKAAELATTIVSFVEQAKGWLASLAEKGLTLKKEIDVFPRLHRQLKLYCRTPILEFDESAATEFQRLRKLHRRHGTMDLKIASIALAQGAILVTQNVKDFRDIQGLQVEDWLR